MTCRSRVGVKLRIFGSIALQGTGRMALQTGLHPAQLKDSVTSESDDQLYCGSSCAIADYRFLQPLEDARLRACLRWKTAK
jgi:hypothetical protein